MPRGSGSGTAPAWAAAFGLGRGAAAAGSTVMARIWRSSASSTGLGWRVGAGSSDLRTS